MSTENLYLIFFNSSSNKSVLHLSMFFTCFDDLKNFKGIGAKLIKLEYWSITFLLLQITPKIYQNVLAEWDEDWCIRLGLQFWEGGLWR